MKVDWAKKLSHRAKAEILGALIHDIVWHTDVKKPISKKLRKKLRLSLGDCSILATELNKVDYKHMVKYLLDLEDRT